jgi:hypothetical protein
MWHSSVEYWVCYNMFRSERMKVFPHVAWPNHGWLGTLHLTTREKYLDHSKLVLDRGLVNIYATCLLVEICWSKCLVIVLSLFLGESFGHKSGFVHI